MTVTDMNQSMFDGLPGKVKSCFNRGNVASYIPALSHVPADKFGVSACCVDGEEFSVGDTCENFSLQSISKAFALVFALHSIGDDIWQHVGRRVSAMAFNAITPLEESGGTPRNPFTNAGAIVIVDTLLSQVKDYTDNLLLFTQSLAKNNSIDYDLAVATSEKQTGHRNIAIAQFLKSYNILKNPVDEVLDSYFLQCSLSMNCNDLSRSFLFLANRGSCPFSGHQVLTPQQCQRFNALLLMFGAYDGSGDFVFRIGLPGKTGVGGGIAAIVPGKASIATWSPSLDEFGTSVAGLDALEYLTESADLSIL